MGELNVETASTRARRVFGIMATLVLLAATMLIAPSASAAQQQTWWVATTGDDGAAGTQSNPWRTIQHAVNSGAAGDTILVRSGVYAETVSVGKSGSAAAGPLTISSAPGELAVLDGTNADGPTAFSIVGQQWVTVSGFEIRNYTSTGVWELAGGFYLAGAASNITIADNDIHDIVTTHPNSPIANGIGVYGTSGTPMTDITIENNKVHDLTLGWSEAVVVNGNVDGFEIRGNEVHDNDNIGIDVIGYESWLEDGGVPPALNRARNGVIADNHVYNIDSSTNPVYNGGRSAGGIYVDGGTQVRIEGNVIRNANIGIEVAAEAPGGFSDDVVVIDNEISRSDLAGIALGGYQSNRGTTRNVEIRNNTFYDNAKDAANGAGEIWFQFNVMDNEIADNIVHGGPNQILLSDSNSQQNANTFIGNLYDVNSGMGLFRVGNSNVAMPLTDPDFVDAPSGDFRLAASSPAHVEGTPTAGTRVPDLLGRDRVVGGFEPPVDTVPGGDGPVEVAHVSTCIAGNGRVDTNIINTGSSAATYRISFGGLSPRELTVGPGDWWRMPITGRPDGSHDIVVLRDGANVSDTTVEVSCDTSPPALLEPDVQVVNACRGGLGYLLFQFANAADTARSYVIKFEGVPNRSTTAGPWAQTVRAVTGRPNGPYQVKVESPGYADMDFSVQVGC